MKIYAVIVTCNAMKWMEKSLSSLFCDNRHSIRPHVIVADNASTDGSLSWLAEEYPRVDTILLDRNYGFAEGYNQALSRIEAE